MMQQSPEHVDREALKCRPWDHLGYFVNWGLPPWRRFVEIGLRKYLGGDLAGRRVLEIGPGNGRITGLFALLGAQVTALDVSQRELEFTGQVAHWLDVADRVRLVHCDGTAEALGSSTFDVIFTKSALVYQSDLRSYLLELEKHLAPGGQVVFIENALGNPLWHLARWVKRRSLSFFRRIHFFREAQITAIKSVFSVELVMRAHFPPVILICGRKRPK